LRTKEAAVCGIDSAMGLYGAGWYNIFIAMNDTGNSFGSNPASLKGKLQTLEVDNEPLSNKSRTSPTN